MPYQQRHSANNSLCWGRLVENAVGSHFCNGFAGTGYSISYWREGDREVDFVVSRGSKTWAIEVKSGRSGKLLPIPLMLTPAFRSCRTPLLSIAKLAV